jgi:hypothetical protein
MQNEAKAKEDPVQDFEELEGILDETEKDLKNEKRRKTSWKVLAIAIICICLYQKKSRVVWLPVADSQQMCVMVSDWWGLKVRAFYPVWTKPTGATGEYSEQWCIKYPDNTWQVFYSGNGPSPTYKYSATTYSTYF